MSDLRVEVETAKRSIDEIRPTLDEALEDDFHGGLMKGRWEGEVLHLSGPGAQGRVRLEGGRLVAEAHLGLPASLLRSTIEAKLMDVLERAAG